MNRRRLVEAATSLLNLARTGWMLRGVPGSLAETVAEHSFLTAFICLELADDVQVGDVGKLAVYGLLHDLGEAFIGDIVKNFESRIGEVKDHIELDSVEKGIESEVVKRFYQHYALQQDFEANMAKLCNYIATYLIGLKYKKMGFNVDDIVENTKREIEEFSRRLGIWDIVKKRYLD